MSDKRWERLREKFATEQASPTPCPMFTLPEVAMLFERIAELEAQRRATAKTLGAIIERLETQAADFAKVGNREGELLAETYRAYAADLRSLCGVESD